MWDVALSLSGNAALAHVLSKQEEVWAAVALFDLLLLKLAAPQQAKPLAAASTCSLVDRTGKEGSTQRLHLGIGPRSQPLTQQTSGGVAANSSPPCQVPLQLHWLCCRHCKLSKDNTEATQRGLLLS
jgi:hypothetical protein